MAVARFPPFGLGDHVRGAIVLFVAFAMLVLGTPGLDMLAHDRWLPGTPGRARQEKQPFGAVAIAASDLNRAVREPVEKWLTPLQRPLRLAQSWGLYGAGPNDVRRFEIRVDDRLVYRSQDPEHAWLRKTLRYRKIRPIVDAHCSGSSKNSPGLARWIALRAAADFPGTQVVEVRCTVLKWNLEGDERTEQRLVLRAPDWEPTK